MRYYNNVINKTYYIAIHTQRKQKKGGKKDAYKDISYGGGIC